MTTPSLDLAVNEYIARQSRQHHPAGKTDGHRWYPAVSEHCSCCNAIRTPSRKWPWSLMLHCRTAVHVAALYGVNASDILRAARSRS